MNKNLFSILLFALAISANSFSQTIIPKQSGICFRWDDNSSLVNYSQFFALFNKYGFKATLGLNYGNNEFDNLDYRDSIKKYQAQGHEMMDHTPNHRTNFFFTKFNPSDYDTMGGVDHRSLNKICLKFATPNLSYSSGNGTCNINDNIVTASPGSFGPFSTGTNVPYFLYFPALPAGSNLVLIDLLVNSDGSSVRFTDVWNDPIHLGNRTNVQYYTFSVSGIRLTIEAIRVLANESRKLALSYGIQPPTTWIEPGITFGQGTGNSVFPNPPGTDLKTALTPLGYTQGASYVSVFQYEANLTFNEYDPNDDAQFRMQWGDFSDQNQSISQMKSIIANYISDNKSAIGLSHGTPPDWSTYISNIDGILSWCKTYNIPVMTYKQLAELLYTDNSNIPDPYQNVFPNMSKDLDANNYPDGYDINGNNYQYGRRVVWIKNDGPPGSNGASARAQNGALNTTADDNKFGGIEKGLNDFEIWTKGNSESGGIRINFSFFRVDATYEPIEGPQFVFPANTTYWKRYTLEQSTNGTNSLNIPADISTIFVTIQNITDATNEQVGGIKLFKRGPSLNLTATLEGAYNPTSNRMSNTLLNIIPTYQPYGVAPFNFNGDTLVTNNEVITQFSDAAGNVVDWVLVELRDKNNPSTIVSRKAGLIRQNGSIIDPTGSPLTFQVPSDQYYISVRHRNHLMIRSTSPVSLTAGQTTSYNFTTAGNSVGGKQIDTSPVVWGMIAGDVNGNGQIQNNDNEDFIDLQIGQTGYRSADINMDGIVDANDNTLWHQNNGLGEQ